MQDWSIVGPDGSGLITNISIPAKTTVELKFMGKGLLYNGASGLKQGDHIPIGLVFEKSGQIPALIEIRATPE